MSASTNMREAIERSERESDQVVPFARDKAAHDSHGEKCGNCGTWRNLVDGYFIEKCPNCGDDETYIFQVEELP